jgi:hypothetical protein
MTDAMGTRIVWRYAIACSQLRNSSQTARQLTHFQFVRCRLGREFRATARLAVATARLGSNPTLSASNALAMSAPIAPPPVQRAKVHVD